MSRAQSPIDFQDQPATKQAQPFVELKGGNHQAFGARSCAVCGQQLSVHEQAVGDTCGKADCKNAGVRAAAQAEYRRRQKLRERAATVEKSVVPSYAEDRAQNRALGVLPSNDRRFAVLPERRIRVFRDRLMQKISEATAIRYGSAEPEEPPSGYDAPSQATEEQLAVLGNACATCRGDCCSQGGDHAFINADTILAHMKRNPKQRPREILDAYLSRIGNRSYEMSCVYHSDKGCGLPREMRSSICNGFLCRGASEVLYQLADASTQKAFVVTVNEQEIVRAAAIDRNGFELYQCAEQTCDATSADDPTNVSPPNLPPRPSQSRTPAEGDDNPSKLTEA